MSLYKAPLLGLRFGRLLVVNHFDPWHLSCE